MNFSSLKQRVANETGLDTTNDDTNLGIWVNQAYKHVNGIFNWPWLLKAKTIQSTNDITTGTATVNASSTSVSFSVSPSAADLNSQWMIQFTGASNDWYFVSSFTGGGTSMTLASAFNGTTNYTAGAYILRQVFYSLPSDVDRIVDLRQARTTIKLGAVDVRTFDKYLPDPTAKADPMYYYLHGQDSSGNWQIGLYPIPNVVENLQLRYLAVPADLTGTQVPNIPEKFHDILVYGALYMFAHPYIDDTRYQLALQRYTDLLSEMKLNYSPIPDQFNVIQPWDTRPRRLIGRLQWPSTYPEYWR